MIVRLVIASLIALPCAAADKPALLLQLGHTGGVEDLDLYRAGKERRVVTLGKDAQIKVWRAGDGSLLATHPWPLGSLPRRIFVTRDGRTAIVLRHAGAPIRFDLDSGEHAEVPGFSPRSIGAACLSGDRRRLAVARRGQPLAVYELPDLTPEAESTVETSTVGVCRFSRGDRILATGERDGHVSFFDGRPGKGLAPIDRRKIDSLLIDDLDEAPRSGHWVVLGRKETVIWDLEGRRELARYRSRGSNGFVRWTADEKRLVVGAHGSRALRHLDPLTGKVLVEAPDPLHVPEHLLDTYRWLNDARGPGPVYALRRRDDAMVEVWNGDDAQRLVALYGHPLYVTGLMFLDDRHLALGASDGRTLSWDLRTGVGRPLWTGHSAPVTALALSSDGRWAATADRSGQVLIRERTSGRVDRMKRIGNDPTRLEFLSDAKTLLVQASSRTLMFDVLSGFDTPPPEDLADARRISWDQDGKRVAFTRGGSVHVGPASAPRPLPGNHRVTDLLLSPSGDRLLVATGDGRLLLFDGQARPLGELETGGVRIDRLAWSPSGRLIAGVGEDAAIRFWVRGETRARVSLLLDQRGEWIAWTGEGAFDASRGGGRYVAWRVGRRVYPVDRFRERFQVPGLLRLQLDKKATKLDVEGLDDGFSSPPQVRILTPTPNDVTDKDLISVTVEVEDTGGGISELRLYHQGRLVEEARSSFEGGKHHRRRFDVLLEPGRNLLHATALSEGRVESTTPEVAVVFGEARERVRLRLLSVGIDEYRDPSLRLKHARADAEAIASALSERGERLFKGGIETRVVTDAKATRQGVLDGFDWLIRESRADDVAVVYLAGHGDTVGEEYYFLPQDLKFTGLDAVKSKGISQTVLRDLIRRIPARKLVVLLDTCKSGAVSLGFASRSLGEKKALSLLGQAAGIYLVAASTSQQLALEDGKLGHGLFTWSVLRGLEGHADFDEDKAVTIRELVTFLESEVSRVSKETFDQEQFPVTHGNGRNFPLAIVR